MVYEVRTVPSLNFEERLRQRQLQQGIAPQSVHEEDRSGEALRLDSLSIAPSHARRRELRELPSFLGARPRPSPEAAADSSLGPLPTLPWLGPHGASQERLDVPQSVSPGRTPVGSPRRAEPPEWHDALSSPAMQPSPAAIEMQRPPFLSPPQRTPTAPLPASPPSPPRDIDPLKRSLEAGYSVLEALRYQDPADYESNDKQQRADWCGIRDLKMALESWGVDVDLQRYQPQRPSFSPTPSLYNEDRTADWAVQVRGRLMQLRMEMQRASVEPTETRSHSPQQEFREITSPALSRHSSNASGRGSFFGLLHTRQKSNDPMSVRSSVSGDSLFSRDSYASSASAISSAKSAISVPMTDRILTPAMIEPILEDLRSIQRDEWTFEQCTASLPSVLRRIRALEYWLLLLRIDRKTKLEGIAPLGSAPSIDLRPSHARPPG